MPRDGHIINVIPSLHFSQRFPCGRKEHPHTESSSEGETAGRLKESRPTRPCPARDFNLAKPHPGVVLLLRNPGFKAILTRDPMRSSPSIRDGFTPIWTLSADSDTSVYFLSCILLRHPDTGRDRVAATAESARESPGIATPVQPTPPQRPREVASGADYRQIEKSVDRISADRVLGESKTIVEGFWKRSGYESRSIVGTKDMQRRTPANYRDSKFRARCGRPPRDHLTALLVEGHDLNLDGVQRRHLLGDDTPDDLADLRHWVILVVGVERLFGHE